MSEYQRFDPSKMYREKHEAEQKAKWEKEFQEKKRNEKNPPEESTGCFTQIFGYVILIGIICLLASQPSCDPDNQDNEIYYRPD
jgi:hypothetical protein